MSTVSAIGSAPSRGWSLSAALVGLLACAGLAMAGPGTPELTAAERVAVERYEILPTIVPTSGSSLRRVRVDALCNAPIALVHDVITDVRGYERFMPKMTRSRVLKTRGNERIVLLETRLPWPIENAWNILKVVETTTEDAHRVTWEAMRGSLEVNRGFWLMRPYEDGHKTLLSYEIEISLPGILPDAFVHKHMKKVGMDYMYAVRAEVKKRKSTLGLSTTDDELGPGTL